MTVVRGSMDTFDADEYMEHLARHVGVSSASIDLAISAGSTLVTSTVWVDTWQRALQVHEMVSSLDTTEAALILGVDVERINAPVMSQSIRRPAPPPPMAPPRLPLPKVVDVSLIALSLGNVCWAAILVGLMVCWRHRISACWRCCCMYRRRKRGKGGPAMGGKSQAASSTEDPELTPQQANVVASATLERALQLDATLERALRLDGMEGEALQAALNESILLREWPDLDSGPGTRAREMFNRPSRTGRMQSGPSTAHRMFNRPSRTGRMQSGSLQAAGVSDSTAGALHSSHQPGGQSQGLPPLRLSPRFRTVAGQGCDPFPMPPAVPLSRSFALDTTGDGQADSFAIDTTGDGNPDTIIEANFDHTRSTPSVSSLSSPASRSTPRATCGDEWPELVRESEPAEAHACLHSPAGRLAQSPLSIHRPGPVSVTSPSSQAPPMASPVSSPSATQEHSHTSPCAGWDQGTVGGLSTQYKPRAAQLDATASTAVSAGSPSDPSTNSATWEAVDGPTGRYYYHTVTRETSWNMPWPPEPYDAEDALPTRRPVQRQAQVQIPHISRLGGCGVIDHVAMLVGGGPPVLIEEVDDGDESFPLRDNHGVHLADRTLFLEISE